MRYKLGNFAPASYRDRRQTTFVTNAEQILSVKSKPPTPLLLTDNIKLDGIPSKIKWKIEGTSSGVNQALFDDI